MSESKQLASIGDFLRGIREIKKLKQTDVSRKMGLDSSTICRYESNQTRPSLERANDLVEGYELTKEEEEQFREILNLRELRLAKMPKELQILSQLLMLPESVRKRVIQTAIAYDSLPVNKSK